MMRLQRAGKIERELEVTTKTPKIVVFACKWCGLIGADGAGKKRLPLPLDFRLIPVECAARVEPDLVIQALSSGIDGVAVLGCHLDGCRYNHANHRIVKRMALLKILLDTVGIESARLLTSFGTAHEAHQFADLMQRFFQKLKQMPSMDAWNQSPANVDIRM